jgi:hypothetical protein
MKTNSRSLSAKIWLATAAIFVLLLLAGTASAQWSTDASPNIYYNSGKVGIGTNSPGSLLSMEASGSGAYVGAYIKNTAGTASGTLSRFSIGQTNSETVGLLLQFSHDDSNAVILNRKSSTGTLDLNTTGGGIRINNAGNVGIGTTSPGSELDVRGSISGQEAETNTIYNGGGSGASFIGSGGYWGLRGNTSHAFNLDMYNGGSPLTAITVLASGKVGIGTTPSYRLHVQDGPSALGFLDESGTAITFLANASRFWSFRNAVTTGRFDIRDDTTGAERLSINSSGKVGIGTTAPNERLEVSGNLKVSAMGADAGNITATGTIEGGNIKAKYQDVAEWVPSSKQMPAGTVVVLDTTKSNQVISSTQSYDTRVAGVISEQPGIALGESGANKVLVATTGRVLVKVDASSGPIHIGDLLVTSDIPGVAMKSEPITIGNRKMHMPGTLIGKALEPLEKGSGKILVLLSLQ